MDISLLIGANACQSETMKQFTRTNPYDQSIVTTAPAASVKDAVLAVEAASEAFITWSKTLPSERRDYLQKASDLMLARIGDFTKVIIAETGATAAWAGFNVTLAAQVLREAAAMTTQLSGEVIPSNKPDTLAMGIRVPAGVTVGIAPWNAPVILATRAIAMPIACGNTVILKAAELCPATHWMIGKVLIDAGFPAGVVNVLTNAPEDAAQVVEALIAHPAVRRVNFTGSTKVGRIIGELCGRHLKPAILELGGKAPFIVLDDANIDGAVNAAAFGAFMNQGQICMSTERIIVEQSIADKFITALAAKTATLTAGNPNENVVLGTLISLEAAEKMDALIADALAKGAKLLVGGKRQGTIVEATLLDHVTKQMRIYNEESFGPVKSIIRAKDENEAIDIANDTDYGLSSAVFSNHIQRAMRVANAIRSGICHINGPTVNDEAQMPFGGVKDSGYGRFGGKAAISEFTDLRWITIEDPDQHYPF